MSNATQNSRQSGDSQRRRSRGGRNRNSNQNQGHDNRRSGDRDGREGRDSRENRNSGRAEEFRPQSPRPARTYAPAKLSWWQKLLKAVGLYKVPPPPSRQDRNVEAPKPPTEARPAKSNTRNARTGEGPPSDRPEGSSAPRGERGNRGERGERSERGERGERGERSGERQRGGDRSTVESARVYVGNLSYEVSEQDLQELFKGIGGVRNVEIVYNRSTHRSKGYGFVEMLHMDEAIRAVEVLHDQPFMGRKLTVSGAKSKGQDEREDNDEPRERAQRPVVVAPRPAPAVVAVAAEAAAEPVIQTIVETVTEAAPVEAPVVEAEVAAAPVAEAEVAAAPVAEAEVAEHQVTEAPVEAEAPPAPAASQHTVA